MTVRVDMGVDGKGDAISIDLEELLATRLLVQGNSGSGKSHLLRRLLEKSAGQVQQVVIDPEGDFVTLADRYGHEDAEKTKAIVEGEGRRAILLPGDLGDPDFAPKAVQKVVDTFGRLDVVVNNAGEQHPDENIRDITDDQLRRTFQSNIFSMFYLVQAAQPHLKQGAAIINCTSVTMYKGSKDLLDYSATKGAITAFTRSLSANLVDKGIRVNAVAPGPIWTPLNPSGGKPPEKIKDFGKDVPMGRPGQPNEVAPSFLFLACDDSSYMTGQVLHPNGGVIVNG